MQINDEHFTELLALMRKQIEQNGRAMELWRDETRETKKIQRELVTSIVDLRLELEHQRTKPERDQRLEDLDRRLSQVEQLAAVAGG